MSGLRSVIETVLAEHGVQPHVDAMHSWRCNETDRFPDYCSCVPELVGDLEDLIVAENERLRGAVDAIRGFLGEGEVDDADIAEALYEWGV